LSLTKPHRKKSHTVRSVDRGGKFQDTTNTFGRTIGPLQMLRSLSVIDTKFTILRHFLLKLWPNEILR
jgi:hypothetical protein